MLFRSRLIVSLDKSTLPSNLTDFCRAGQHSPGIVFLRSVLSYAQIVELLHLIAYATWAHEWADTYRWVP